MASAVYHSSNCRLVEIKILVHEPFAAEIESDRQIAPSQQGGSCFVQNRSLDHIGCYALELCAHSGLESEAEPRGRLDGRQQAVQPVVGQHTQRGGNAAATVDRKFFFS